MLDQLTHGRYRSRPHRVRQPTMGSLPRYSFPLFFDFAWTAEMKPELRWAATTFCEVKGQ
ncbi:hypothetical protein BCR34DRAFT_576778 [Clohesyomyces aquaticus]|uniref:Isopenicillin N synthase-like Fe(2+) 2OG dioxygenase domain-containing protein n=1 Tax=Clohesyomyces aquaticus TaxID=1231657 RepID=A0A1Y1YMZ0_9PLEO|nr:hypothetical protein BCR34DRAFT_576778 [Clohesyomyces aquaticus]